MVVGGCIAMWAELGLFVRTFRRMSKDGLQWSPLVLSQLVSDDIMGLAGFIVFSALFLVDHWVIIDQRTMNMNASEPMTTKNLMTKELIMEKGLMIKPRCYRLSSRLLLITINQAAVQNAVLSNRLVTLLGIADRIQALAAPLSYHVRKQRRGADTKRVNAVSYGGAMVIATLNLALASWHLAFLDEMLVNMELSAFGLVIVMRFITNRWKDRIIPVQRA